MTVAAPHAEFFSAIDVDPGELLALQPLPSGPGTCAFLGGSLAEGLGNATSDLDVYVVGPEAGDGWDYVVQGRPTSSGYYKQRRCAFQFWTEHELTRAATALADLSLEPDTPGARPLDERLSMADIGFLHRVRVSIPLVNEPALERLRDSIDIDKMARYLMLLSVADIDRYHEDVCGALDAHDVDTGLAVARSLVEVTCDAYLHRRGSTNIRRKWRAKLLNRLTDDEAQHVYARFMKLSFPSPSRMASAPEGLRMYLEACLRFSNEVCDRIGA